MHIQNNNALIYWLGTIYIIVNDIAALNTDIIPLNHGERTWSTRSKS